MARTHARIYTSVWTDDEFRSLSANAQRVFMLVLSQHDLSWAGVAPYTPRRWANLAKDTKAGHVERAIAELAAHRYVVVDETTDEVWIRTFVKHDKVLDQPNVAKAMWSDFDGIQSRAIKDAFRAEYPDLFGNPSGNPSPNPSDKGSGNPSGGPRGKGKRDSPTGSSPSPEPSPTTTTVVDTSSSAPNDAADGGGRIYSITEALHGGAA